MSAPHRVIRARRSATKKQGGKCFWCDIEMMHWDEIKQQNHSQLCTADHLNPKSLGGSDDRKNIVASCNGCNQTRKDLPLSDWLNRVKFRLKKAGNPEHFQIILTKLESRGIVFEIGPTQRANAVSGLTNSETEPRRGSQQSTLDP